MGSHAALQTLKESSRVRAMFSAIAPRYDLLNHLLSFNQDRKWRRILVDSVAIPPNATILDICSGTGDLGIAMATRRREVGHVVAADFSMPMLAIARKKVQLSGHSSRFSLNASDALNLPYRDAVFDLVVCAYGVRNFEDTKAGLHELSRVTKAGGRLLFLEFFPGRSPFVELPFRFFFRGVLPALGKTLSKHDSAYSYLPDSVDHFCSRQEMERVLTQVGYTDIGRRDLAFGITTLFSAVRAGGLE